MQFHPSRLGITINLRAAINDFKLDKKQTVQELLSLPFDHVRIPIPMDEVMISPYKFDFDTRDWLIEEALKKNKKIHLQFGIKTIGWPEVHAPIWLFKTFPYLNEKNIIIDQEEAVKEAILTYLGHAAKRYLLLKEIVSIQVENEPFSKRLWVSRNRSLSPKFNKEEITLIGKYNLRKIPILQNAPFDTVEQIPSVIKNNDIVGLNIYPQVYYQLLIDKGFWFLIRRLADFVHLMKKPLYITEYQTAAWLNGNLTPSYPFYLDRFENGFTELKKLKPEIIFLWDVEQVLWKAKRGDKEHWQTLQSIV